jgi:hypothetical protein
MWTKRFDLHDQQMVESGDTSEGAFVAVPAMMGGGHSHFQQQLYNWAYEQAKQSVQICRPAPLRDLFAVMN